MTPYMRAQTYRGGCSKRATLDGIISALNASELSRGRFSPLPPSSPLAA